MVSSRKISENAETGENRMIDFTELQVKNKTYRGANGSKLAVVYNNEQYMLKFPPTANRNHELSYANSCISEYLGCHIFESLNIPVQDTILGIYKVKDKEKVVVACKDFTSIGIELQDFASLKNQVIDSEMNGYGTELDEIIYTFEDQKVIDVNTITERFWDMFIVDALIGNWDRHNGNWGFLYDVRKDSISLAPVYDCGSSLYPQADDVMMKHILLDKNETNHRIFNVPTSAIKKDNRRINYFQFISSLEDKNCNLALKRIVERLDMAKIVKIVEDTPYISSLQKEFYRTMLCARKERILDYSLGALLKKTRVFVADRTHANKSLISSLENNQHKIASAKQNKTVKPKDKEKRMASEHNR